MEGGKIKLSYFIDIVILLSYIYMILNISIFLILELLSQISNRKAKKSEALIDYMTAGTLNDTVVIEALD